YSSDSSGRAGGRSESGRARGSHQRTARHGLQGPGGRRRSSASGAARADGQGSQHLHQAAERGSDSRSRPAAKILNMIRALYTPRSRQKAAEPFSVPAGNVAAGLVCAFLAATLLLPALVAADGADKAKTGQQSHGGPRVSSELTG